MKSIILPLFFLVFSVLPTISLADLDSASDEALQNTQKFLVNKEEREIFKGTDPSLKKIDKDLEKLVGDKGQKEEVYKATAKILEDLARETGGDPEKMLQIMEQAQKDPKAFYLKHLSKENKKAIRGIAEDIDKINVDSTKP